MPKRDIILLGASSGGIEPLINLVRNFPKDMPAYVFVVVHVSPEKSILPEVLSQAGYFQAVHATHRESFQKGKIYVSPPNHHMLLADDRIELTQGPKENG